MADAPGTSVPIEELLQHSSWVKALARQLLPRPEAAEDLVQETWLSAIEHPPRDRRSLTGWLRTLMRRAAARTASDDRTRVARESAGPRRADSPSAADLVAQAECQRMLVDFVLELPDPYRSTLLLRYFGDLSLAEIAERTSTPDATVRAHHQRALEELRKRLAARGQKDPGVWRSVAILGGGGGSAKALGATGVVIMTAKAKGLLAAGILVAALAMVTIWSPRIRDGLAGLFDHGEATPAREDAANPEAMAATEGAAASSRRPETISARSSNAGRELLGRVVDPDGAPVPGASVFGYPETMTELVSRAAADRPGGWPRVTKTDADGFFAMGDVLPSPPLEVVAAKEGWQSAVKTRAATNEPITLTLGRGVSLRGRVRDFANAPIRGARVCVNEIAGLVEAEHVAIADSEGSYEVRGLGAASRYYMEVGADEFATQWINQLPEPDASGARVKDFYLGRGGEVVVVAVDAETGRPLANARILAWAHTLAHGMDRPSGTVLNPKHVRVLADVRTGPDGRVRISRVPSWGVHPNNHNQRHYTEASLGGVAALAEGYAVVTKPIAVPDDGATEVVTLACRRAASIAGRVVDEAGRPIQGARMWARPAASDDYGLPGPIRPDPRLVETDSNGAYVLKGVPSSETGETELVVGAWLEEGLGSLLFIDGTFTVKVSGTGTTRAPDLVMKSAKGILVHLRVLDPAGLPLWGVPVGEGGEPLGLTDREGRVAFALPERVEEDGKLQPYQVSIQVPGFAHEQLRFDRPPEGELVVRLQAGSRIAGRVIHSDGSPAGKAWVHAAMAEYTIDETFPPNPKPGESATIPKGERVASTQTDASGAFEIVDVQPRAHHLEATMLYENRWFVRARLASVPAGARDALLTIERPPPPPVGNLRVTVRDRGTKRPVLRCAVSLKSKWRGRGPVATEPGVFVARDLAPGKWTVTVRAPHYAGLDPIDVTIPENATPVTLDVELERGITMRGRLKVAGIAAFVAPRAWTMGPGAPAITIGPDGAYSVEGLTPGASYEVHLGHHPKEDLWESFVTASKVVIPEHADQIVARDLELVPSGGLGLRVKAPRIFDTLSRVPESDDQWRLAQDSRVTVKALDGTWFAELKSLAHDNNGWRPPLGRYVVRIEVPGAEPQEQTVAVTGTGVVYADFTVP